MKNQKMNFPPNYSKSVDLCKDCFLTLNIPSNNICKNQNRRLSHGVDSNINLEMQVGIDENIGETSTQSSNSNHQKIPLEIFDPASFESNFSENKQKWGLKKLKMKNDNFEKISNKQLENYNKYFSNLASIMVEHGTYSSIDLKLNNNENNMQYVSKSAQSLKNKFPELIIAKKKTKYDENKSKILSLRNLLFEKSAFKKKDWTEFHDDTTHKQILEWIEKLAKKKFYSDGDESELGPLKLGFGFKNKKKNSGMSRENIYRKNVAKSESRKKLLINSINELWRNKDKWIPHWESISQVSFGLEFSRNDVAYQNKVLKTFSAVLFFSDMIDTILDILDIEKEKEKIPLIRLSAALFQSKEATGFFDQSSKYFRQSESPKFENFKGSSWYYPNISTLVLDFLGYVISISNRAQLGSLSFGGEQKKSLYFKSSSMIYFVTLFQI